MLSREDEQAIERVLEEFARRGQTGAAETAALLAKLPARPEVIDHFIGLAKTRGLPWVEYLARNVATLGAAAVAPAGSPAQPPPPLPVTGAQLSSVLASDEPYPRKVEALLAALRARHPELPGVIRKHMQGESDPFVLATLCSALGQCGTALDGAVLAPLLNHPDNRVVANSLDALRRLRAPPRAEVLVRLLESPDQRVRTNAIAFLGVLDPDRALELVRALVHAHEPVTRAGVAYVLGELRDQEGATELLLEMNELEQNMAVLKQIAVSLKKHAGPDKTAALIGALHATAQAASGAKRSVVGTTLHEIAVEAGMVASEVERVAADHRAKHGGAVAAPAMARETVPFAPVVSAPTEPAGRAGSKVTATASFAALPPPAPPPAITTAAFSVNRAALVAPPPPVQAEEDEELTFAGVWGAPQAASPATTTGAMKAKTSPMSRSGSITKPSALVPAPDGRPIVPAPAGGMAWGWLLAGVAVLGAVSLAVTLPAGKSEPGPVASASARPAKKSRLAGTAPVATSVGKPGQNPVAAHLGPAGAAVSMNGRVVGITSGRPVLECQGQYYLVVKGGRSGEDVKRGQVLAFSGKIMGSSQDGLFYVEENAR